MILLLFLLVSQFNPDFSPKFQQASRLLQEQKFSQAIAILDVLVKEHPAVAEYWNALGIAHAANGNTAAALKPLETSCDMKRGCFALGRLLQSQGRHAEAIAAFNRAPQFEQHSELLASMARSSELTGDLEAADLAYRRALAESALRPAKSAEIQVQYSRLLIRQCRFEPARWQLDQSLRKKPFNGAAWRDKAYVLIELDRKEQAVDALEQAIAHGERTRENLLALSRLHADLGNREKAEEYLKEATPIPPR